MNDLLTTCTDVCMQDSVNNKLNNLPLHSMKTLPSATRPREGKIDRNTVNNSVLLLLDERKEKHPIASNLPR